MLYKMVCSRGEKKQDFIYFETSLMYDLSIVKYERSIGDASTPEVLLFSLVYSL